MNDSKTTVAYFSMEIGLRADLPTYAGGLGILAGDTLRAAADLGLPMVAVTLVHRQGYFTQQLDDVGNQSELPDGWSPESHLQNEPATVELELRGRTVRIGVWRFAVIGARGQQVDVLLLDTADPANHPEDRRITDQLYGGDDAYRLCQEAVLGLGGVLMLRALGYSAIDTFHMNEGHSSLLALAVLEEAAGDAMVTTAHTETVRRQCVFTTHTPVPAGHDQFTMDLTETVLGSRRSALLRNTGCCWNGLLNMTHLALRFSRYVNGVAMRHGEISRALFPQYPVESITNGVHPPTWALPAMGAVFDRYISTWRSDSLSLRYAVGIPAEEIRSAHETAKAELLEAVASRSNIRLAGDVLTIGFARRAARYKAADLIFHDLEALTAITESGPLQLIFAGKAHPRDAEGKAMIRSILAAARRLQGRIDVVYLADYDWPLARLLCGGCDVWLNTPQKPQEASGTSGMKAAVNGVPSFSVLDGWWIEGHVEGVTGWSIGDETTVSARSAEAASMYEKLHKLVIPAFYGDGNRWACMMRSTIALNASFFNAQRMVQQYAERAYGL
jgi:glycogen phosphorylase